MKNIFEDYAGEIFLRKVQGTESQAERKKISHLAFALRHSYRIKVNI